MKPFTLNVEVTQADIDKALELKEAAAASATAFDVCCQCPAARAAKRALAAQKSRLKGHEPQVGASGTLRLWKHGSVTAKGLNNAMAAFVHAFDAGKPVEPTTFTVEMR